MRIALLLPLLFLVSCATTTDKKEVEVTQYESTPTVKLPAPDTTHKVKKYSEVIGWGGSVIREIVEKTGAKIDIEEDGTIKVSAVGNEPIQKAIEWIKGITAEPEVGKVYDGTVVKIMEFGAFVNIMPKTDGLVHISELAPRRVAKVEDVVKEGDKVKVKCLGLEKGKIKLSMKVVDQQTGEEIQLEKAG